MLEKLIPAIVDRFRKPNKVQPNPVGVPNPGVRIIDGKIVPNYACQVEIVSQCNLSCRDCNHLSPIAKNSHADPESIYRDFSMLAKVYRPQLVYLAGGEPLLHPDIVPVIKATRASGIADRILVLTNGILLPRMTDAFWESIDDLEISVYPDSKIEQASIDRYQEKAKDFNVHLEVFYFNEFRRTFSLSGSNDESFVQRIYQSCKAAHVWGCHYLNDGYFYKCPQSAFLPRMVSFSEDDKIRDRVKLRDAPDFRDELYEFLTSPKPLAACRHCLGTAGVMRPHVQVKPKDWISDQNGSLESMVDYQELSRIEAEMHIQKPDHIKRLIGGQNR